VHDVTKAQNQLGRKGLEGSYAEALTAFRVRLHRELAEIRFEESLPHGMKLVGPFVL
jgi:hypothetical protein